MAAAVRDFINSDGTRSVGEVAVCSGWKKAFCCSQNISGQEGFQTEKNQPKEPLEHALTHQIELLSRVEIAAKLHGCLMHL
jgi:hypothetical protein